MLLTAFGVEAEAAMVTMLLGVEECLGGHDLNKDGCIEYSFQSTAHRYLVKLWLS